MHQYRVAGCGGTLGEAPGHTSPPMENPTCVAFEEYEEVPEMLPLDIKEDAITWVASKLSGTARALGVEAIGLSNCLVRFG